MAGQIPRTFSPVGDEEEWTTGLTVRGLAPVSEQ
jgi:hypothetical protein